MELIEQTGLIFKEITVVEQNFNREEVGNEKFYQSGIHCPVILAGETLP